PHRAQDGNSLGVGEVLTRRVLSVLAEHDPVQVHNGHGDTVATELLHGPQAAGARNQAPIGAHDHGVQEANLADAVRQAVEVAVVVAIAVADHDVPNGPG